MAPEGEGSRRKRAEITPKAEKPQPTHEEIIKILELLDAEGTLAFIGGHTENKKKMNGTPFVKTLLLVCPTTDIWDASDLNTKIRIMVTALTEGLGQPPKTTQFASAVSSDPRNPAIKDRISMNNETYYVTPIGRQIKLETVTLEPVSAEAAAYLEKAKYEVGTRTTELLNEPALNATNIYMYPDRKGAEAYFDKYKSYFQLEESNRGQIDLTRGPHRIPTNT